MPSKSIVTVRGSATNQESSADIAKCPEQIGGRVYLAYPLSVHNTPLARRRIHRALQAFPLAEVLPACDLYASNVEWLSRWPEILPTLSAVCVFTNRDGWVGKGVWIEVHDALARELPVYLLTAFALHEWVHVRVIEPEQRDYRRFSQVLPPAKASGARHG